MKKLLILLLLIPNFVMAETWVCSYPGYLSGKIVQITFKKSGKYFISDSEKCNYSESKNYLSLACIGTDEDGGWIFSHIINKKNGDYRRNALTDSDTAIAPKDGSCSLIK